jgi:hypothetical protein
MLLAAALLWLAAASAAQQTIAAQTAFQVDNACVQKQFGSSCSLPPGLSAATGGVVFEFTP